MSFANLTFRRHYDSEGCDVPEGFYRPVLQVRTTSARSVAGRSDTG